MRLLPVVIFFAFLTLGVRGDRVAETVFEWTPAIEIAPLKAQNDPTPPTLDAPAEESAEESAPPAKNPVPPAKNDLTQNEFSDAELETLRTLSARRAQLDGREQSLETREGLLIAAEERIDKKVAELNLLEERIRSLIVQYDEQEKVRLQNLSKIYENMKPKDAARIFEELDIDILINVINTMSRRKVAPILAAMSPGKAERVTSDMLMESFIPRDDQTLGAMLKKIEAEEANTDR